MRETLILDMSGLSIHQRRRQDKIFFEFGVIFFPQRQRPLQIIILKPFVIIHQLNEISYRFVDSEIPQSTCIVVRNSVCQRGNIVDISCIMKLGSCIDFFIHDKNNLKIFEGLTGKTFRDILHILISPGRDNYTEFHS